MNSGNPYQINELFVILCVSDSCHRGSTPLQLTKLAVWFVEQLCLKGTVGKEKMGGKQKVQNSLLDEQSTVQAFIQNTYIQY